MVRRVASARRDARGPLSHEPIVPGLQVRLIHRPISVAGDRLGISLDGSPQVDEEVVGVVDGFRLAIMRTAQQNGTRSEERLNEVRAIAQPFPNLGSNSALPAKPRKRGNKGCNCVHPRPRRITTAAATASISTATPGGSGTG